MSRRQTCVIYAASSGEAWRAGAERGGPMGEVVVGDSLAHGLNRLGYDAARIDSFRAFARRRLRFWARPAFTFFEPWTLDLAVRYKLVGRRHAARCYVLESFGTAPDMIPAQAPWLETRRILVPFPAPDYGWNTFLGFTPFRDLHPPVDSTAALRSRIAACLTRKKPQGVIWGKEAKYFHGGIFGLLESLAKICPLHATVAVEPGNRVDLLPAGVVNHGVMGTTRFRALLEESSFLLGLGDPVSGFSAVDALAAGCVYLNPRFSPPRLLHGNPQLPLSSQVPFAESIGAPFVQTIDLRDVPGIQRAATQSLDAAGLATALDGAAGRRLVDALAQFTETAYLDRLRAILHQPA